MFNLQNILKIIKQKLKQIHFIDIDRNIDKFTNWLLKQKKGSNKHRIKTYSQ
jgi:hypothetical protein